ncbi:MAG TPA: histidine kinase dimerization/phospho-acceptor domain-containing protein [Thermoanaerobaculia bacterium]
MPPAQGPPNERILIVAPTGRDAQLTAAALESAGLATEICPDVDDLCSKLRDAGAALITEEALTPRAMRCLREALDHQSAWADLPLLIFTSQPSAELTVRSFETLGTRANITMIERPIRVKTLISAAAAALRARRRQYEIRDLLSELERRVEERDQFLAMLSHELRNPLAAITLALETLGADDEANSERAIIFRQTRAPHEAGRRPARHRPRHDRQDQPAQDARRFDRHRRTLRGDAPQPGGGAAAARDRPPGDAARNRARRRRPARAGREQPAVECDQVHAARGADRHPSRDRGW